MAGIQPVDAGSKEPLLPADDGRSGCPQLPLNGAERGTFGQHQDQTGAEDVSGWQRTGLSDVAELALLALGEDYGIAGHVLLDVSGTTNVISATATRDRKTLATLCPTGARPVTREITIYPFGCSWTGTWSKYRPTVSNLCASWSHQKGRSNCGDWIASPFCACCGAEITLKTEACPLCGAPQHGMLQPDLLPTFAVITEPSQDDVELVPDRES